MADTIIESLYDFRNVTVPEKLLEIKVSEETVKAETDRTALRFAVIEAVDGPIRQGDFVRVELIGGEELEIIQINVGKGFTDEALENSLYGMCRGDVKVLTLDGKESSVRVLSVKRRTVPQLTDELIQELKIEGVSCVREYREHITRQIAERAKGKKQKALCDFVSKAVIKKTVFAPIDENNSDFRLLWDGYRTEIEAYAAQSGQGVDSLLNQVLHTKEKSAEDCWAALRQQCADQVKLCALGKAYASEDGVTYTRDDARKRYLDYAGQTGMDPSVLSDHLLDSSVIQMYADYFDQKIADYYADKFHTESVR